MHRNVRLLASTCFFAASLAACGGSGEGSTIAVGITSSSQALTAVEDAETPGAIESEQHLWITVERVKVHVAGEEDDDSVPGLDDGTSGPPEKAPPGGEPMGDDEGGGWFTVFEGSETIDLLHAGETEAFLAEHEVPAGKVTQIRLVLAGGATLEVHGEKTGVTCPSCSQSGLKVVTSGGLSAPADGVLEITLEFDADASLVSQGDGKGYIIKPVIRLADAKVQPES